MTASRRACSSNSAAQLVRWILVALASALLLLLLRSWDRRGWRCATALACALFAIVHTTPAQAVYVDQELRTLFSTSHVLSDPSNRPIGQEFVPTVAPHVAVILPLDNSGAGSAESVTVTVRIRERGIGGPVVTDGTVTRTLTIPPPMIGFNQVEFAFSRPVVLDPGELYVLEVESDDDVRWHAYQLEVIFDDEGNPINPCDLFPDMCDRYASGRGIVAGVPNDQGLDFGFQTVVIPGPPGLVGAIALSLLRRPRSAAPRAIS